MTAGVAGTDRPGDPIVVSYDGTPLNAVAGEPLAIAMMRAGRLVLGRSPVLGRPRGFRAFDSPAEIAVCVAGHTGIHDPGHLALEAGMDIRPCPAAPADPPKAQTEEDTDILVIGAGPAGLVAALTAARSGAQVSLVEADTDIGGTLRWSDAGFAQSWVADVRTELAGRGVVTLTGARAVSMSGGAWLIRRGRACLSIRAKQVIYAAGAVERTIAFSGNDLPGVMTADALVRAIRLWGFRPDGPLVVFGAGGRDVVRTIRDAGCADVTLIDPGPCATAPDTLPNSVIEAALGTGAVEAVRVRGPSGIEDLPCRILAVAGGVVPDIAPLSRHAKPIWNPAISAWLSPPGALAGIHVAGAAGGSFGTSSAMKSGYFRARRAVAALGLEPALVALPSKNEPNTVHPPLWQVPGPGPSFVDFHTDLTLQDAQIQQPDTDVDAIARRFLAQPPRF